MAERRGEGGLLGCTVSGLATRDIRAASLLVRMGVDLCDDGLRTIAETCELRRLDPAAVATALGALDLPVAEVECLSPPWWALDELCAMLVERHHQYFRHAMPAVQEALAAAAGSSPGALAARPAFAQLCDRLTAHLSKEEHLVFPALVALAQARRAHGLRPCLTSPNLLGPIRVMEGDHRAIEDLIEQLGAITHGFTPEADAAPEWRACCHDLAQFVHELQTHVHLENGLLFPRALELESEWG